MIGPVGSRQVAWFPVHEFVVAYIAGLGDPPLLGTPAWCELPDADPRKLAAVLDAGQHWALHLDARQAELAEVSRVVSEGENWSALATRTFQREAFYEARPWLKRVSS